MKKRIWIPLVAVLAALLVALVLFFLFSNSYNKVEREGWDIYSTLDCFVKTSYNKEGNPVKREVYRTSDLEKLLVINYRYDKHGTLCDLRMDGKDFSGYYFKNARFSLHFNENGTQRADALFDNQFESLSFLWDDDGKLVNEYFKPAFIADFTYDEKGGITKEYSSEASKSLEHQYSDDGSRILITEADSLTEEMTLTLGENGMPQTLTRSDYTTEYVYDEKDLCTEIKITVLGQTVGDVLISYDKKGNPIKREVRAHANGKTTLAALYEYTYDDQGNLTAETLSQVNSANELKVGLRGEYLYDKQGNMIQAIRDVYSSPGNLTSKQTVETSFDGDGNKTEIVFTHTNGDGTLIKDKGATRYFADGTRSGKTEYTFYSNMTPKKIVETDYTKDGYILKQETKKFREGEKVDGVLTDGALSSKTLFESTKEGVPLKSHGAVYREDGSCSSETETLYYNTGKAEEAYIPLNKTYYITCTTKTEVTTVYYDSGRVKSKTTKEYEEDGSLKKTDKVYYDEDGIRTHRS